MIKKHLFICLLLLTNYATDAAANKTKSLQISPHYCTTTSQPPRQNISYHNPIGSTGAGIVAVALWNIVISIKKNPRTK